MKVIDLLNKIANGEELPTKIRIWGSFYYLCENDNSGQCYFTEKEGFGGFPLKFNTSQMNDEVEIIKDNKIRKLDFIEKNTFRKRQNGMTSEDRRLLDSNFRELGNKINEIIDYINKGDKE